MVVNPGNLSVDNTKSSESLDDYYKESFPDVCNIIKRSSRATCTYSTLLKRVPIVNWLPKYKWKFLLQDFIAGLTVGLTAIPQGIAYAVVAGLGPQYGLYSAFMGCFVYIIFGSCKDITVGPTAIMSLMVQKYVSDSPDFAVLSCFLTGCIVLAFGLLHLGFLVQFISAPVTNGFTTAAAITIASGQVNSLLGIPSKSNEFLESWENFFDHIEETRPWDATLGVLTLICLLLLRKCNKFTGKWKLFGKYLSLSRNALAVIIGVLMAYIFSLYDLTPFRLTGDLRAGLPPVAPPPFSTVVNNGTTHLDFIDMVSSLSSSIIAIPLVVILESIAIAKAFSKGKTIDASQEMIALGLCNIGSSFFSSMPITGSFTRTAVNNASGVVTPLGGLFTGVLVLLGLGLLTETFYYIPKTVLSAIIISAMIFMIHYEKIIEIWKSKRIDIIPFIVTVITCLFLGLELGIVCGIVLSLAFVLFETSRPKIYILNETFDIYDMLIVKPSQNLIFSSAEYMKDRIIENVMKMEGKLKFVIVDGEMIRAIDSTVALNLRSLCDDLKLLDCEIVFWNWKRQSAGVAYRLSKSFGSLFQTGNDYHEIIKKHNHKGSITSDITVIS
ncbi:unnamed protein product [Hermetia illucens]|uniref:STAS domain-containing protein n=1 Tax=Hermetia illucens TaxID=343691 RepID=A0A7R8UNN8_HERIL|nr:sodium-independent sulfate anion transporter-like [Hermetia illucens]CAD7084099.1 unnamed protein product [Hermetia illucens]